MHINKSKCPLFDLRMPILLMLPHTSSFSSLIAHNSDVNKCFSRQQFIEATSKYWAQWSLFLVCCSSRMRRVIYCWVPPLRDTWPVYFFLYWGCCNESANSGLNQKTWKNGLILWSKHMFFTCEFVSFPVCHKWLYLSVCMFYSFTSTFVLTCTVAVLLCQQF